VTQPRWDELLDLDWEAELVLIDADWAAESARIDADGPRGREEVNDGEEGRA
jgi:hypothetical protein